MKSESILEKNHKLSEMKIQVKSNIMHISIQN